MTFEELDKQRERQGIPKNAKIKITHGILGFRWKPEPEEQRITLNDHVTAYIGLPQTYDSE